MVERSGAESSGSLSIHSIWIQQNRGLVAVQAALFVQNVPARKPAQLAQGRAIYRVQGWNSLVQKTRIESVNVVASTFRWESCFRVVVACGERSMQRLASCTGQV